MFQLTRLKLTIWYTVVLIAISGTLSVLFYNRTADAVDRQFALIEQRLQRERTGLGLSAAQLATLRILPAEIAEAKQKIINQLLLVNSVVLVVFAAAGYILSGKTLRPIQLVMDEQKRFIGDAAHELKTPLTALKTSLEVNLMDKNLPDQARTILNENLQDVNSLQSLTESLLQLAWQENNAVTFRPVSVQEVVNHAIEQIQPLANRKHIQIVKNITAGKMIIQGHRESLIHLLVIFLDNAVKYSPDDSTITVTVTTHRNQLTVQISDQGIGIDAHHLPHIFDRFYRVDSARTKSGPNDPVGRDGYGLGLAVAKKIIDQHHGSVSVQSEIGHGTTFTIKLPR